MNTIHSVRLSQITPAGFVFTGILILSVLLTNLKAESVYIQILRSDKGFSKANYNSIFQDQDGFLWLSTQTGLIQYSGAFLKNYTAVADADNEIRSEFFYQLLETKNQEFWIATRNGLTWMDANRKHSKTFVNEENDPESIPNNRIFNIIQYKDSVLFLACDRSGITWFNIKSRKAQKIQPVFAGIEKEPTNFWIREYFACHDTAVFLRTAAGYFRYNPTNHVVSPVIDDLLIAEGITEIRNLFLDRKKNIWIQNSSNELFKWDPDKLLVKISNTEYRLPQESGYGFFQYDPEHILVNTSSGNFLVNMNSCEIQTIEFQSEKGEQLNRSRIMDLLRTDDDNVFIAFRNGFLGQINPYQQEFRFRQLVNPEQQNPINNSHILDDTVYKKRYISNYHHDAIIVEDLKTGAIVQIPKFTTGGISANKMLIDSRGRLWICQGQGIMEVNRATLATKFHKPDQPASLMFEIAEIRPGVMMAGSFSNGLFRFEPDKGVFTKEPETRGWMSTQVFSLKYDPKHDILWIGTVRNGLFRYDIENEIFTQFLPESGNPYSVGGDWIRSLAIDSLGYLWMTADPGGLSRFDYNAPPEKAFITLSIKDGLPSNHISGLGLSADGTIWISSLGGIASLNPDNFEVKTWEVHNGVYNYGFHYANLSINSLNQIFVGTLYGYIHFDPSKLRLNTVPPKVYLTDFLLMDQGSEKRIITNGKPLRLRYNENAFSFEFAVVNFNDAHLNNVLYSLDKSTPEWQEIRGSTRIYFPKTAPGSYTLRLKASNSGGIWSNRSVELPVRIDPPFWNTWWFYGLLILVMAVLVFAAFRYRLNQLVRENQLKSEKQILRSEMEREIANLEMVALRSLMNPHFIFNCLNSINRFIIINDNQTASEYLTKFSRLIRLVLDNSRSEKISLRKEVETLRLYIEMEKLRFVDKFEYELFIDPDLNLEHLAIQPMLIQPYIENAIWHGLMHKLAKGNLQIALRKQMKQLVVTIQDNGIGRKQAMEIKSRQMTFSSSHGMKVTAERLAILNKKLNHDARIHVTDLYDAGQKPAGTLVELILPLDPF